MGESIWRNYFLIRASIRRQNGDGGAAGKTGVCRDVEPHQARRARRDGGDRRGAGFEDLWQRRRASVDMPNAGDELHHFGWNACSSCLCPYSPHPHMERRYLIVPGLRSSRIHMLDTKPDPRQPKIVKVIEPEDRGAPHRVQPAAHRALRSRRHLHQRPGLGRTAMGRAASSSWTRRASTCGAAGKSIAGRSTWPTISGGISGTTP